MSDSRFTWIHDFEENLTKSVGPVLFSAQYLICRHVQTDRQTDKLIWGGLGNLRFLLNCSTDRRTDGQMDSQTDELIWGGLGNLRFLQVSKKTLIS